MSGINTEYTIYLKVLTPLHIGGAQEKNLQENLDYIHLNDGSTWRLDWEKVYGTFDPDDIANAILKKRLRNLIANEIEDVAVEIDQTFGDTREIKAFIRDGFGNAYIPGSSIKGAMKSWVHAALEKEFGLNETKNLLGTFDSDIFRFIEPSDCKMKAKVEIYPTKTFNLRGQSENWEGGWKHAFRGNTTAEFRDNGFVTDYECFPRGAEGRFILRLRKALSSDLKTSVFSKNNNAKKSYDAVFQGNACYNLFDFINTQIQKHINRELTFFNHFNEAGESKEIIRSYQALSNMADTLRKDQCLFRLSAGSGFHGITGDFQFNDHTKTGIWNRGKNVGKMKYKSRKIAFMANEKYPMGFVLISTQPFADDSISKLISHSNTSQNEAIYPADKVSTKIEVKGASGAERDASQVKKGDIVFCRIISVGKPFCTVQLLLSNYAFSGETDLSGTRKYQIETGQIVKCQLGDPSADGEFKQVKFVP